MNFLRSMVLLAFGSFVIGCGHPPAGDVSGVSPETPAPAATAPQMANQGDSFRNGGDDGTLRTYLRGLMKKGDTELLRDGDKVIGPTDSEFERF